jgi:hypothetical protein
VGLHGQDRLVATGARRQRCQAGSSCVCVAAEVTWRTQPRALEGTARALATGSATREEGEPGSV